MTSFVLGNGSLAELAGVHPSLVAVVKKAIGYTTQDFSVTDGLRTEAEQRVLVNRGASKTMNSMHRKQPDGFGHAVDLVPYLNGKPRWEWPLIWAVAVAVDRAATELNVPLVWGAVWDKGLMSYGGSAELLQREVDAYKARRKALGKSWFGDGPHYQLA